MKTMTALFALLSIISLPIQYTYLKNGAYKNQVKDDKYDNLYFWPKYSIGNMGFSTNQCSFTPFIVDSLHMSCPYGQISEIVEDGVGINKNGIGIRDGCTT